MLDDIVTGAVPSQVVGKKEKSAPFNPDNSIGKAPSFKATLETVEAKPPPKETSAETKAQQQAKNAVTEFRDYMEKTPEQRMREMILGEMGLTEEALANMSPEDRAKVEEKIKAKMEERLAIQHEKKLQRQSEES